MRRDDPPTPEEIAANRALEASKKKYAAEQAQLRSQELLAKGLLPQPGEASQQGHVYVDGSRKNAFSDFPMYDDLEPEPGKMPVKKPK